MRLGLSVLLVAALASSLAACSSDSTGSGGSGGAGSGGGAVTGSGGGDATTAATGTGGDATTTSATGTGGDDTTSVTTGTGGSGGGDGLCVTDNVGDPADCDIDCDATFEGSAGIYQCTLLCDALDPENSCGVGYYCFAEFKEDEVGACLYDCAEEACPGTSEYICDQDFLVCVPDGVTE